MMRPFAAALAAAFALPGFACRPDSPRGARVDANGGSTVTAAGTQALRLELVLPAQVRAGERIAIRLRAQNVTDHAVDLYLRGRTITFDVEIARPGGAVVWHRLEGEIIPAIVQLRVLAAGETLEVATSWDQRTAEGKQVDPGDYVAQGLLLVEGEPLRTPPKSLSILKR
jgi:Intracellular proteinase inhibitor